MSNYTVPAIVCTQIILISKELYFIWHLTELKDLLWIQIVHCMLSVNPISLELWEQNRIKCSLDQFTHKLLTINVRYIIVFWRHYKNIGNITLIANTRVIISVSRIRKRCLKSCMNERKCLLQDSTLLTPPWLSANYWPNNIRILKTVPFILVSKTGSVYPIHNRICPNTIHNLTFLHLNLVTKVQLASIVWMCSK